MATQNWSMTLTGYPAHARSGTRVVGATHMSTFAALRLAEAMGIASGWLFAEGNQPQLAGVRAGAPVFVQVGQALSARMVVQTEGLASGSLVFAAAAKTDGEPLTGRTLIAWAEAKQRPWVEVVDNEQTYWGGLDDRQLGRLLAWFLGQRPLDLDWLKLRIEPRTQARLALGLFEHGWTRNLELVRRERMDVWGGVHRRCPLDHGHLPPPSQVHRCLRLRWELGEIEGREAEDRCPLDDETGKSRVWSGEW
ncbi:MAG: hypothetical protein L6R48_21095 [Planctomycetes bacterium]|jgi:hypothetical protein|nr:hypothetical protein [Planctomycetota bacterium]